MMARLKSFTKGKQSRQKEGSPTSSGYSEIAAMFEEVSEQPQMEENIKHSFKAFLRMENSRGQPELMDMLPALDYGT